MAVLVNIYVCTILSQCQTDTRGMRTIALLNLYEMFKAQIKKLRKVHKQYTADTHKIDFQASTIYMKD